MDQALSTILGNDCVIADLNGAITQNGKPAIRERYSNTFSKFPKNRAWVESRIAIGNLVIDHEKGERAPGGETFEAAVIYTIKNGRIARVDFAR